LDLRIRILKKYLQLPSYSVLSSSSCTLSSLFSSYSSLLSAFLLVFLCGFNADGCPQV
jgi:hypothetical protein